MLLHSTSVKEFWPAIQTWLKDWDLVLFHKINMAWTGTFGDLVLPILRDQRTWYPLYFLLLFYVIYKFKWKALPFILFAGLTVVLTDQISSSILKPFFHRTRPCSEDLLVGQMRLLLSRCPSSGSFTSSHAVNHFGIAAFIVFSLKSYFKRWVYLFYLWAFTICYAQVYVGVHYPGDVLGGAILGILLGWCTSLIFRKYFNFGKKKVTAPYGNQPQMG